MSTRLAAVSARESAEVFATLLRDPLAVHTKLARHGEAVCMPIGRGRSLFLFSRPEFAEHVLALNQDNYAKAATYRPLRALIGDGLLTSEGAQWRHHRRLVQPVFSRRDVLRFGPFMSDAVQRMLKGWESAPDGAVLSVSLDQNRAPQAM